MSLPLLLPNRISVQLSIHFHSSISFPFVRVKNANKLYLNYLVEQQQEERLTREYKVNWIAKSYVNCVCACVNSNTYNCKLAYTIINSYGSTSRMFIYVRRANRACTLHICVYKICITKSSVIKKSRSINCRYWTVW